MALKATISLRQKQRLAVTQQMQQSVAILGMSNTQLTEFLREEQTENPLLDLTEPQIASLSHGSKQSPVDIIADTLAERETLIAGMVRQLNAVVAPTTTRKAAEIIISNLNSHGFLDEPLDGLAKANKLPIADMEKALDLVQSFEPPGVGARSFMENIELQLRNNGVWSNDFEKLLQHLSYKRSHSSGLAAKLKMSERHINEMISAIRSLSFRPSDILEDDTAFQTIPDVLFQTTPKGEISVSLNEQAFPRLQPESAYLEGSLTHEKDVKEYLNARLQRVKWLRRALEKRAATILRISIAISEIQIGFFKTGPLAMKPLTRAEIATKLEIHESTVSRAIANKFFTCDTGTFPMQYLFSPAVTLANGHTISTTVIRARIRRFIDAESPKHILSDIKIAEMLNQEGIVVARRTIAKYRGDMNVPTSSIRRIQKRNK
ncbi:MAG: RNA polymerase factor sigma-54 [Rhodobacteraceae bacterium]|nr:RNA polymerase factor sigma-54 [Paracoccaceae bacterium]